MLHAISFLIKFNIFILNTLHANRKSEKQDIIAALKRASQEKS